MWGILGGLLLNYLILNCILRCIGQFGRGGPHEYRYIRGAYIRGAISAISVLIIGLMQHGGYLTHNLGLHPFLEQFGISIFGIGVILILTFAYYRSVALLFGTTTIIVVLFCMHWLGGDIAIPFGLILAATIEEISKGAKISSLYEHIPSDSIIWGLCCGLSFAWTENMIYILSKLLNTGNTIVLILQRSITTLPLHTILTGLLGYIIIKQNISLQKKTVGVIGVVAIHICYNYTITYQPILIIPSILLIYLVGIQLIEKVDRIYITHNTRSQ